MDLSRLGSFAIEERLGGPRSSVFRAVHVKRRIQAAVTVLPAPFFFGPDAQREFAREFETLKTLRHANVARCFGGGISDSVIYLAHEFVDGESLEALLARRGRLPWEQVVEISLQLCAGLNAIHSRDLLHRRLAPDKIIVDSSRVKIVGLRDTDPRSPSAPPISDALAAYQSPEQFQSQTLTPRSDLYALGCVMQHMLTGTPPFTGTPEEIQQSCKTLDPPRVGAQVLDCPIWLDSLLQQLLAKDPNQRPFSAAAAGLALRETQRNLSRGASVAQHAAGGLSALRTKADREQARKLLKKKPRARRKPWISMGDTPIYEQPWFLVLCLVAALGVILWMMQTPKPETLLARAEKLMSTGERMDAYRARDEHLQRLVQAYPESPLAEKAKGLIDEVDMLQLTTRLRNRIKLGKELETEPERMLAEVWKYEQFGDRVTALEKYRSMATLLEKDDAADQPPTRTYLLIARTRIEELTRDGAMDRREFLNQSLEKADELLADGQESEARRIWLSIIDLYKANQEVAEQVAKAQERLGD